MIEIWPVAAMADTLWRLADVSRHGGWSATWILGSIIIRTVYTGTAHHTVD